MGDQLSGLGAPQGPADNVHYVYSGGGLAGEFELFQAPSMPRLWEQSLQPYQRALINGVASGGRVYPLVLPRSRPLPGEVVARLEAELVTAGLPLVVRKRGTS